MRIDHAREIRIRMRDPHRLVGLLGLEDGLKRQARGVIVRCPVHAERTASCSVRVAEDGTIAVRCHGCDWTGDALSLIAVVRGLDLRRDFQRVLQEAAGMVGYDLEGAVKPSAVPYRAPQLPARARPPVDEVERLWAASSSMTESGNADVAWFITKRGMFAADVAALDVVRVLPKAFKWPKWWPEAWAAHWCLVTRAYEPNGAVASLHARCVIDADPKTRWPYDCRADGLVFADRLGADLLRGESLGFDRVLVVEGLTDLVWAALWARGRRVAVLGITSGSVSGLPSVRWPGGVPVVIATDQDQAGERYASAIASAIPSRIPVRRWRVPKAA
jgi:hypothetical protein